MILGTKINTMLGDKKKESLAAVAQLKAK